MMGSKLERFQYKPSIARNAHTAWGEREVKGVCGKEVQIMSCNYIRILFVIRYMFRPFGGKIKISK